MDNQFENNFPDIPEKDTDNTNPADNEASSSENDFDIEIEDIYTDGEAAPQSTDAYTDTGAPLVIGGETMPPRSETSGHTSSYSYSAGTSFNSTDSQAGSTTQGGVRTTYVSRPAQPSEPPKKKERRGVPVAVFIICLVAGIVMSAVFGAVGVALGYSAVSDGDPIITNDSNGNGILDAEPSEKIEVELPEGTVAAAAALAGDSVVEITTETVSTNFFYGQFVQSGAGSGVIIDADDGYIITCAHVVDGASSVTVILKNGDKHEAKLIGSDSRTDIAVIQIDADNLVAANIGNSDNLVVGQTAIAIGNPLGTLGGTVSSGIISALNREITIDGQGYTLLQIDTSINPGNSGGGLFDIAGNLIGIVNAKSGGDGSGTTIEGLGFAIPINQAIDVAAQLTDNGYVGGRVSLGIYVYEVNAETNSAELYNSEYRDLLDYIKEYGVYFLQYQSGQKGDFEFGDRIIAIDGIGVSDRSDILELLEEYSVGDAVTVTVSRLTSDMERSRIVTFETTLVEQLPETE